jgi:protein ImuA
MPTRNVCKFSADGAALHEVVASPGGASAAVGFGLALAGERLASAPDDAALLWVREASAAAETGDAYGPGLARFGVSPDCLIVVETRTKMSALRAALEGARCAALSAVILETSSAVDLTASRRLKLAAEKSGVAIVLIRLDGQTVTNAAQIRWRVEAAPRCANLDDRSRTAFRIEVLKHSSGIPGKTRIVEWDHERRCFVEAISLPVATVSDVRPLAA